MSAERRKGSPKRTRRVPLADVHTAAVGSTQVRERTDDDTVTEYAAEMQRGVRFPPVRLVEEPGAGFWIADGWHRVLAAKKLGRTHVPAILLPPIAGHSPHASALRIALGANRAHGLRLTRGDQGMKARRALLDLPSMRAMSDRKIALELGVGPATVSRARAALVRERLIPHPITERLYETDRAPAECAGVQAFRAAFGDVDLYDEVLAYLAQVTARAPADWEFHQDDEDGEPAFAVAHAGIFAGEVVTFPIRDNPIVNGFPARFERRPSASPHRPLTDTQRDAIAYMTQRQQYAEAARILQEQRRPDLVRAVEVLTKYREVPGLWPHIQTLVRSGGPSSETPNPDF